MQGGRLATAWAPPGGWMEMRISSPESQKPHGAHWSLSRCSQGTRGSLLSITHTGSLQGRGKWSLPATARLRGAGKPGPPMEKGRAGSTQQTAGASDHAVVFNYVLHQKDRSHYQSLGKRTHRRGKGRPSYLSTPLQSPHPCCTFPSLLTPSPAHTPTPGPQRLVQLLQEWPWGQGPAQGTTKGMSQESKSAPDTDSAMAKQGRPGCETESLTASRGKPFLQAALPDLPGPLSPQAPRKGATPPSDYISQTES